MRNLSLARLWGSIRHPRLRPLFNITTHLTDSEKLALHTLARRKASELGRPAIAVEIGSYLGASSSFIAAAFGGRQGKVICIDTWNNDAMSEGPRDTMTSFLANTARFADRVVPVRGWSTTPEVARRVEELVGATGIDLLFIDGDHAYEAALSDWSVYSPLLAPGAYVAMHDIGWADGVRRVVADHIQPRMVTHTERPNLWWGRLPG